MNNLLWVDVETTGLDPIRDDILALGMMLTDSELNHKGSIELVFYRNPHTLRMSPFVLEMHTKNGLLEQSRNSNYMFCDAAYDIRKFLESASPVGAPMDQCPYVAGSTINFDRSFLLSNWPWYRDHVHYRSLDVSSLRTEISLMRPELLLGAPAKRDIHLPLADIEDSQNLLRFLRSKMWGVK